MEPNGILPLKMSQVEAKWVASEFSLRLQAMRARLATSWAASHATGMLEMRSQAGQVWPASWTAKQVAAGRFLVHFALRMRAREWDTSARVPAVWRPPVRCQCQYGQNLAKREEFEEQAARASTVLDWDRSQAHLLKRLESGRAPLVLDLFCCAGGVSEGFRRAGRTSRRHLLRDGSV